MEREGRPSHVVVLVVLGPVLLVRPDGLANGEVGPSRALTRPAAVPGGERSRFPQSPALHGHGLDGETHQSCGETIMWVILGLLSLSMTFPPPCSIILWTLRLVRPANSPCTKACTPLSTVSVCSSSSLLAIVRARVRVSGGSEREERKRPKRLRRDVNLNHPLHARSTAL